ncbi:MAG: hypothetical protein JSV24_09190 [Bacteroidales bacterium]|nr:MAG: hypothetical protein JSV24_09190 [Bacteroidales bacterium]
MDRKKIEDLLQKFYEGDTNRGEERMLEDFFNGENIPNRYRAEKDIFTGYKRSRKEDLPGSDLEQKIMRAIKEQGEHQESRLSRRIYLVTSIAASLLLLIGAYFLFLSPAGPGIALSRYDDTFDNPDLAYLETKKTLLMVSEKLNEGTKKLENLSTFEKGTSELKNLSKVARGTEGIYMLTVFGNGVKELEQLSTFSWAQEMISSK